MKNSKRKKIKATFDQIEESYPDKSLEWVTQMVCDEMERYFQHPIDFGDVMESITEDEQVEG